jgi:signal peptidase II
MSILVIVLDQITKTWIRSYSEGQPIFESALLQIVRGQNTGVVFGTFQGFSFAITILTSIVIIVLITFVIIFWRRAYYFNNLFARTAVSLYIGGALGNLTDRVRFGSVTDFIDFRVWPSFNVADASMTTAVIMFIYSLLFLAKPEKSNKHETASK